MSVGPQKSRELLVCIMLNQMPRPKLGAFCRKIGQIRYERVDRTVCELPVRPVRPRGWEASHCTSKM